MMDNEAILQKIFSHPEMRNVPVGYQSIIAHVLADILADTEKKSSTAKAFKKPEQKGGADNE